MKPVVTLALMMAIIPASLALADKDIRDNAGNLSERSGITAPARDSRLCRQLDSV